MRTTLDIADDVLFAAKGIARREEKSLGQVISELARDAIAQGPSQPSGNRARALRGSEQLATYGVHPLPARGGLVTNELIDRLRDQKGV